MVRQHLGFTTGIIATLVITLCLLVICKANQGKNMTCNHTTGCVEMECGASEKCVQISTRTSIIDVFPRAATGKQACKGSCKNLTCQAAKPCPIMMYCSSTECSQETKAALEMRSSALVTKQECRRSKVFSTKVCRKMLCSGGNKCEMNCNEQICWDMLCDSKDCKFRVSGYRLGFTRRSIVFGQGRNIRCGASVVNCSLSSQQAISMMVCNATKCSYNCDDYSGCNVISVRTSKQYLKNCGFLTQGTQPLLSVDSCSCANQKSCIQECAKASSLQDKSCAKLNCKAIEDCVQLSRSDTGLMEATSVNASQTCTNGKTCGEMRCHSGKNCTIKCLQGAACNNMFCNNTVCSFTCDDGASCPKVECGSNVKDCKLRCPFVSPCNLSCNNSTTSCRIVRFKVSTTPSKTLATTKSTPKKPPTSAADNIVVKPAQTGMIFLAWLISKLQYTL